MRPSLFVVRATLACLTIILGVSAHALAQDGRYIVKFNPGRGAAGQAAVRAAGGQIVLVLDSENAVAARIPAAALNGLSRNPNVEYIEDDVLREPYGSGSGQTVPYGITMVQADKIVLNASQAALKKICIIDSGYTDIHEDLKEAGVTAKVTDSGSGTWNKDSCGHGTHVAGTISAINNTLGVIGVDPDVNLHIVKVFGDDNLSGGACGWTYSSNLVAALSECRNAGANVVSMSLGGALKSRTEDVAFSNAYKNGVLSIAAAGNAGNNTTSYPAGYSSVVSVAAVDLNQNVASFSQKNKDVELAAPGVGVLSTVPWIETNTLTVGATTFVGGRMDGATRSSGVSGLVVDGGRCTSSGAWSGAIVLCERGDISFASKVSFVQGGGGVAAVIYNNVASDPTCGVFNGTLGSSPTTTIPAITLSCADGASAKTNAGQPGTVVSSVVFGSTGGYEAWDGTSMATPHVSAVAALIWACNPNASNQAVRDALDQSALDRGTIGRDTSYGYGIVQAKAALLRLGNPAGCTILP